MGSQNSVPLAELAYERCSFAACQMLQSESLILVITIIIVVIALFWEPITTTVWVRGRALFTRITVVCMRTCAPIIRGVWVRFLRILKSPAHRRTHHWRFRTGRMRSMDMLRYWRRCVITSRHLLRELRIWRLLLVSSTTFVVSGWNRDGLRR